MTDLIGQLRRSLRRVLREPGVAMPTVGILALAIGAGVTVFSAVEGVLLDPLPYDHPGRLVFLWHHTARSEGRRSRIPAPDVPEIARQSHALEDVAFTNDVFDAVAAGDGSRPTHVTVGLVTPNYFSVLGVELALGRSFRPGEAVLSRDQIRDTAFVAPPSVVVLGYELWRSRFGGDSAAIGRTLRLDDVPYTIIGVAPRGFELVMPPGVGLASEVDAWTPLRIPPALFHRDRERRWQDQDSDNSGAVIARMAPDATLADVRAEMRVIAARQRAMIPAYRKRDVDIEAVPVSADAVAHVRPALLALLAAVALVLLIASLNVAGLFLTRNLDRIGELRLRTALGADGADLLREELVHSLVLAALAGGLGLALAAWGIRVLPALAPAGIPRLGDLRVDGRVLGFASLAALAAALASGLLPALVALRSVGSGLDGGSTRSATRGPGHSTSGLIAGQVALSIVLLVGAGLLLRGFVHLQDVRPGFEPRGLATFRVSLAPNGFGGPADRAAFVKRLSDRIRALPGVRAVGVVGGLPLGGEVWTRPYGPAGSPPASWNVRQANFRVINSGYFRALGSRLLAGRNFAEREDIVEAGRVAIVDATLARSLSPDGTATGAVGRRLGFPLDGEAVEAVVVGVVDPIRYASLVGPVRPTIYVPYRQEASHELGFAVRTDGTPADLRTGVRDALQSLGAASTVAMFDFRPMQRYVADSTAPARFALVLAGAFALLALLLAVVGVYGTVAYGVRRRRREIGIRMAVGARPGLVVREMARRGFTPVVVGLAIGLALAAGAAPALAGLLVDVPPLDPLTFISVGAGTLLVGALASVTPARAATRVHPAEVLRAE